jgi:hypothetical protein
LISRYHQSSVEGGIDPHDDFVAFPVA